MARPLKADSPPVNASPCFLGESCARRNIRDTLFCCVLWRSHSSKTPGICQCTFHLPPRSAQEDRTVLHRQHSACALVSRHARALLNGTVSLGSVYIALGLGGGGMMPVLNGCSLCTESAPPRRAASLSTTFVDTRCARCIHSLIASKQALLLSISRMLLAISRTRMNPQNWIPVPHLALPAFRIK